MENDTESNTHKGGSSMVGACMLRQVLQVLGMCLHCTRPRQQGIQLAVHLAGMYLSGLPAQPAEVSMCSCRVSIHALLGSLQRLVESCQPPHRNIIFFILICEHDHIHTASVGSTARAA